MKLLALLTVFGCFGCISPKTWNGDVYECPKSLLESVEKKLEALCPSQPSSLSQ